MNCPKCKTELKQNNSFLFDVKQKISFHLNEIGSTHPMNENSTCFTCEKCGYIEFNDVTDIVFNNLK